MTIKEIIELETSKTLEEIEGKKEFINGCRFVVFKIKNIKQWQSLSTCLNSHDIKIEGNYGHDNRGYIWLRFDFNSKKFITYLNYTYNGIYYKAPCYETFKLPGDFLNLKDVNSEIQKS